MRSKVILVSIILAGALTLSACGDAGQKEKKEEPKRTESTADAETGKEDGNGQKPFTGVSWSEEEDEKYAAYEGKTGMCVDYDNGGVYYVNWSGDKYLYYWKNGKNKLILNKWVSQIAYMERGLSILRGRDSGNRCKDREIYRIDRENGAFADDNKRWDLL